MSKTEDFNIDFIGVGFSRCGTTWIAKCLQEHPEICTPEWKEVNFFDFDYNYNKGIGFYKSFFKGYENKVIGEYCPEYVYEEEALRRMSKDFPDTKIILSLRNPIDRAFSHFLYVKRKNGQIQMFDELFEHDPKGVIDKSMYGKYLGRIYQYFKPEQVLVLIHDDYKNNPKKFIQSIYQFLNVDSEFVPPSLLKEINKSRDLRYRFNWYEHLFNGRKSKKKFLRWRVFIGLLKILKIDKIVIFLRGKNRINNINTLEKEFISKKTRRRLYNMYKSDIDVTESLIGRTLGDWRI